LTSLIPLFGPVVEIVGITPRLHQNAVIISDEFCLPVIPKARSLVLRPRA